MTRYEETIDYIHNSIGRGHKVGLNGITQLLHLLGDPQDDLKYIHVAGTNGKGSTCACLSSILTKAGYKTGLFTSPYIVRFNERMQINGQQIDDDELCDITAYVRKYAESMEQHPSWFEMITAIGFVYFQRNKCDIVVLEVGLGGEFDATNVINAPELAVIAAMGFDHTKELGDTMTSIASAKAGIIKEGTTVVSYGGNSEADAVFEKVCKEKNVPLYNADFSLLNVHDYELTGTKLDFGRYKNIELALAGTYQPYNCAVVLTAVDKLREKGWKITDEDIYEGLRSVAWPGRFELLRSKPTFVIDGAHNPHGVDAATACIRSMFKDIKPVFLVGIMADKDVSHMVEKIAELASSVVTVRPDNKRAMEADELAEIFKNAGAATTSCDDIPSAVNEAIAEAGENGVVIALGSLYFSADVRAAVKALD